ncbi:FkbM family methyltransferase [Altericista sp. CCNU0014]|uniref:FkbM family methyltransferase n=1 Tax=Altericista sp. CCNU0014 TaxID=3082949 RepID=UPI003850DF5E
MSIPGNFGVKASGNHFIQGLLEKNVQVSQYMMGIGSGGGASSSGEQAIFHILRQRFKPPYCIFDVGSNKGQFLQLIIDNIAVDDYSVHCFEPGSSTFKNLAQFYDNDKRIKLNNIGLGKEKKEATLHYDTIGSGLASLTKRKLDHFGIDFNKTETVQIDTIDNYCSENTINCIDLLKIDIEGHELDAFAGAKNMFAKNSVKIVTFEFGGCNIDTRTFFQDFWYLFSELEFAIFRITPSGYLYPIKSYKETYEQFRTTNFIAVSNG